MSELLHTWWQVAVVAAALVALVAMGHGIYHIATGAMSPRHLHAGHGAGYGLLTGLLSLVADRHIAGGAA